MEEKLKCVSGLAVFLDCSEITVYRLVEDGKIPHRRIGRLIRFSDSDIQSYLESVKAEKLEDNYDV